MTDLITRLSKLDAPDREVDAELWLQFTPGATRKTLEVKSATNQWAPYAIDETRDETGYLITVPAYTASVDAAVALAERVLPGWKWRVGRTELFPNGWAYVHKYDPSNCGRADEAACADGTVANPAIALCIALLRAKEATNGQ